MRVLIGATLLVCLTAAACSDYHAVMPPVPATQAVTAGQPVPVTATIENGLGGAAIWYVNSRCGLPPVIFPRGGALLKDQPVRLRQVRGCSSPTWVVAGTIRLEQICFFQVLPTFAITFAGSETDCSMRKVTDSDAAFTWSLRR